MANWRLISDNRELGITSWLDMDTGAIYRRQNVDVPLIQAKNDKDWNWDNRMGRKKTQDHMHKLCEIPHIIYQQLKEQGIIDDPDRMAQWLNSDAAAPYRAELKQVGSTANRRMI